VEPQPRDTAALDLSPFCKALSSKKLTFRLTPPQTEADILDASCHTWCRRTHHAIGPDGEVVSVEDCRRGRSCFEPF